jgi:hypothetical protein
MFCFAGKAGRGEADRKQRSGRKAAEHDKTPLWLDQRIAVFGQMQDLRDADLQRDLLRANGRGRERDHRYDGHTQV